MTEGPRSDGPKGQAPASRSGASSRALAGSTSASSAPASRSPGKPKRTNQPLPSFDGIGRPYRTLATSKRLGRLRRSTSSQAASHAKTSRKSAHVLGFKVLEVASGTTWRASLAELDPDGSWSRTSQASLRGGLATFSGPWPTSGTMRSGRLFPRAPLVTLNDGSASSSSRTLTSSDGRRKYSSSGSGLVDQIGGYPSPQYARWLMGFPAGWVKPSDCTETPSSQLRPNGSGAGSSKRRRA